MDKSHEIIYRIVEFAKEVIETESVNYMQEFGYDHENGEGFLKISVSERSEQFTK